MEPHQVKRLHILGASGSGTTTLGRALASALSIPFFDTDDFYWKPTNPPYTDKRPIPERINLMSDLFLERPQWVLSGSLTSWSGPLIPYFSTVIFLSLADKDRLGRLREREIKRYGVHAISEGGSQFAAYSNFMDWAKNYENDDFPGRSRAVHEKWLSGLTCPIVRLGSNELVSVLVNQVIEAIDG